MNIKKYGNFKSNNSFLSKLKYLLCFVAKSLMYVIGLLFVFIVLLFLIYFVDTIHNKKSNNGKSPLFAAFIIVSPSMVPNINVNDAVVIFRINPKNLKKGDIITFSSSDPNYSGLTVTHRIIGKELTDSGRYVFRTKGDNNNAEDPALVDESKVFGKVFFRIPKLGYIRHLLTTSSGFLILVALPTAAIIIYDVLKLIKKIKQYYAVDYDELQEEKLDLQDDIIESTYESNDAISDVLTNDQNTGEILFEENLDSIDTTQVLYDSSIDDEKEKNNEDEDIEIL